jgi:hypothetical protein
VPLAPSIEGIENVVFTAGSYDETEAGNGVCTELAEAMKVIVGNVPPGPRPHGGDHASAGVLQCVHAGLLVRGCRPRGSILS